MDLVALTPDKGAVMAFDNNQRRMIGGAAKRIARTANGTVVALSLTKDLCMAPHETDWVCVGQP